MYDLEKVKRLESESNAALKTMQRLADALAGQVDLYQADGSRSEAFRKEQIQRARDEALPMIGAQHELINEIAQELHKQKPFYSSKPLMLSCQVFDDDPAKDAVIRMNVGREFEAMPVELLRLAIASAIKDQDLPVLFQGFLAANVFTNDKAKTPGELIVDLDAVDIPDQLEGLGAISQAWANIKLAEFALIDAVGARVSPHKRLQNINERDAAMKDANDFKAASLAAATGR